MSPATLNSATIPANIRPRKRRDFACRVRDLGQAKLESDRSLRLAFLSELGSLQLNKIKKIRLNSKKRLKYSLSE